MIVKYNSLGGSRDFSSLRRCVGGYLMFLRSLMLSGIVTDILSPSKCCKRSNHLEISVSVCDVSVVFGNLLHDFSCLKG